MTGAPAVVVRTGTANLASVLAGLARAGAAARVTEDPAEVRDAERVVLPGVGAFGAGMARLREAGLDAALRERLRAGAPTLAVCLGLQLLLEASDESPGEAGLGFLPGKAERLPAGVRCPQLGWNRVWVEGEPRLLRPGHFYFAHSYALREPPPGWTAARCDHGGAFVAALERGAVLACQFHPELSDREGEALLRRWLAGGTPC